MRTLFISETLPYPPTNGRKQRVLHLLRGVARASDVTLLSFMQSEDTTDSAVPLRKYCDEIHLLPRKAWGNGGSTRVAKPWIWGQSLLDYLHPTVPAQLRWYNSPAGARLINRLCSESFDLIWIERLSLMAFLPKPLDCRVVVDLDDLEHRKLAHRLHHGKWDRLLPLRYLEFLKFRRLERNLLNLPYEFVVCSEVDRKFFGGSKRVSVVPNGFEQRPASPSRRAVGRPPIFLFVGTMCYEPNVDAVRFFATAILPLIRRHEPTAQFLIVGHDPTEAVRALKSIPGVDVTGTVASVESYLREAAVFVAPIRFGGGTRIKILEAMAHGKAVVSTTVGAEGLEVESGKHLLLADSPAAFAESCLLLLNDAVLRARISEEGHSLMNRQYTWNRIEGHVEDIVRAGSIVGKTRPAREGDSKCFTLSQ